MMTVDDLRREVADLRRELDALREGLADEIHTSRLVVDDGERRAEIGAGRLSVTHPATGAVAALSAFEHHGEVTVLAGDLIGADEDAVMSAHLVATTAHYDADDGPQGAWIEINGVAAVPTPV